MKAKKAYVLIEVSYIDDIKYANQKNWRTWGSGVGDMIMGCLFGRLRGFGSYVAESFEISDTKYIIMGLSEKSKLAKASENIKNFAMLQSFE